MKTSDKQLANASFRGGVSTLGLAGTMLVVAACSPAGDKSDVSHAPAPAVATSQAEAAPAESVETASESVDEVPAAEEAAEADVPAGEETVVVAGSGDAESGARAFAVCRSCHTVDVGRNGLGPSLAGVVGRPAGAIEGFNYSDAMKATDIIWTPENLDMHLKDAESVVPGNRMSQLFRGGVQDDTKRADIIAYLATQ